MANIRERELRVIGKMLDLAGEQSQLVATSGRS